MSICPTCRQALRHGEGVSIDLNNNVAIIDGRAVKLRPSEAELFYVLLGAMPGAVIWDKLRRQVYGAREPEQPENALKVTACLLRKKIRPLGFNVAAHHGVGYALRRED